MTGTRNGASTLEHPIGAHGEFVLRVHTGRVDVRGTDGETATVRDVDGRDLEERFVIAREAGRLTVRPRDRALLDLGLIGRGRGPARLDVALPRAATVSIDTASGGVRAEDLVGEQRYRTASGDLELRQVSGVLGIDAVSGSVRVEAAGEAELSGRLVSGDLRFDGGSLRTVALATTSGDVALRAPLDGPGPYSVQTVSGDVEVAAGRGGLRVEAHTVTGELSTDLPHEARRGRRSLVVGEGRVELAFRSISGDLRVVPGGPRATRVSTFAGPPGLPAPPAPAGDPGDDARLRILRDLEVGSIDVETATRRLAELEGETDG